MKISFFRIRACATVKGFALSLRSMLVLFRTHDRKVATPHKTQQHRAFLPFFTTRNVSRRIAKFTFFTFTEYQAI